MPALILLGMENAGKFSFLKAFLERLALPSYPRFSQLRFPIVVTEQVTMEQKPKAKSPSKKRKIDDVEDGGKGPKSRGKSTGEKKMKKGNSEGAQSEPVKRVIYGNLPEGFKTMPSAIKNKMKRSEVHQKIRAEKKKLKATERRKRAKEREKLGDKVRPTPLLVHAGTCSLILLQAPPKQVPRTIENTREFDETVVNPDDQVCPSIEQTFDG